MSKPKRPTLYLFAAAHCPADEAPELLPFKHEGGSDAHLVPILVPGDTEDPVAYVRLEVAARIGREHHDLMLADVEIFVHPFG